MSFTTRKKVRFAHVDAAGIVFYPRYFELLNASVEDYFAQSIGVDFAEMHIVRKIGVPTVSLTADFTAPSRLGDDLDFHITVLRAGRSSAELQVEVSCGDERRFGARVVLVCTDLTEGQSVPWPEDMRPVPAATAVA